MFDYLFIPILIIYNYIVYKGYNKKVEALSSAVDEIVIEFGDKREIALFGRTQYDLEYTLNNEALLL